MSGHRPRTLSVLGLATLGACTAYVDVNLTTEVSGDTESSGGGGSTGAGSTGDGTAAPTDTEANDTDDAKDPESCADILAVTPDAPDAAYTLHVGGDLARPWEVWCADMAGTPAEYLILPSAGPDANFSEFVSAPQPTGSVRTTYSRIRVDPRTLRVDVSDQTYAVSSGQLTHDSLEVSAMAYATAMSCVLPGVGVARGNVDLRGTPFRVWASQWIPRATSMFEGGAEGSHQDQVIQLSISGVCAYLVPGVFESESPINDWGGFLLQLAYDPVIEPTRAR